MMDVVDFTSQMEADERETLARLRAARADVIDAELDVHQGALVKTTGDGLLLEFRSAVDAINFSVSVQQKMAAREFDLPETKRLRFRIGVNVGDVVSENGDIFGDGVNVAARLEALAPPGGIALSGNVHEQIIGKLDLDLVSLGEHKLKGIARLISIWLFVAPRGEASYSLPANSAIVPPLDRPSIVVLPFGNTSGATDDEILADGLTEDLTSEISKVAGFLVVARGSSFVYKGRNVDLRQVGIDLGARYALQGSVRRATQRIRIAVQLVETKTSYNLWTERFDGAAEDIFDIQDRITSSVAASVAPELLAAERARARRKPPTSLDAWECYVEALFLVAQQSRRASERSLDLIERALEIDPLYAQPYGLRGWNFIWMAFQGWLPMETAISKATEAIELGQGLDPHEVWTWIAKTMIAFALKDTELAVLSVQRALDINPNMPFAHGQMAAAMAFRGDPDAGLVHADYAARLSPREMFADDFYIHRAFCNFGAGRYNKGLEEASLCHRGRPYHPYPAVMAMICAAHLEELEVAHKFRDVLLELSPDVTVTSLGATCPYCREEDIQRFIIGLRRAGLPES